MSEVSRENTEFNALRVSGDLVSLLSTDDVRLLARAALVLGLKVEGLQSEIDEPIEPKWVSHGEFISIAPEIGRTRHYGARCYYVASRTRDNWHDGHPKIQHEPAHGVNLRSVRARLISSHLARDVWIGGSAKSISFLTDLSSYLLGGEPETLELIDMAENQGMEVFLKPEA